MSIAVMSEVWRRSQHSGSHLLMLLALADFSDDHGSSYPAVSTLATKCRMKPRNANIVLAALRESGELQVLLNAGPSGVNRYRIVLKALGRVQGNAGVQGFAGVQGNAGGAADCTLQGNAGTPASACSKPLQGIAAEPSLNRQEPSARARRSKSAAIPQCPHSALIALFAEKVPELPKPRPELWAGKKAESLKERWQWVLTATRESGERYATSEAEGLAWFGRFFDRVAGSDFLTGRNGKWTKCTLGWLVNFENFSKVVDGAYENGGRA